MIKCPVCGDNSIKKSYNISHHDIDLSPCKSCSLVFQAAPRKTGVYDKGYFEDLGFEDAWDMKKLSCDHFLNKAEKFLSKKDSKKRLLDIGCAQGFMLETAKKRGYEAWGIEPSLAALHAKEKGDVVIQDTFDNTSLPSESFDVVTMIDVIEHIAFPAETVLKIKEVIKKDGLVLIVTPNIRSLPARLFGKLWCHYEASHICYYSPISLKSLFEKAGFKTVVIAPAAKYLSLQYIVKHFSRFSPRWVHFCFFIFCNMFPSRWTKKAFCWKTGMIYIAQKQ